MWGLLITGACTLGAIEVEVDSLSGRATAGEVVQWTADEIVVQTASGRVTHSLAELLAVRPKQAPARPAETLPIFVELADGSTLACGKYAVSEGKASLTLLDGARVEIPTRWIATVRFKEHDDRLAAQWKQILTAKVAGDVVVIRKQQALDYLEGVLGDVTDELVHFQLDGEQVPVKREKVDALVYFHAEQNEGNDLACVVSARGALRIKARQVDLAEDRLRMVTLAGLELVLPWSEIERVDYSSDKIQYLSDLVPLSVSWTPYLSAPSGAAAFARFGRPGFNRSLEGGPLRLKPENPKRDGEYQKGLALRSRTELIYRLPGKFRRFTAVAGIDDRVGDAGHARLVIHGDDRVLLEAEIAGRDEPQPIDLDISGVRRLKILVDYGDDLDIADHVDLCDARISK